MALITAPKIQAISQSKDPKQAIMDAVGDLSKEVVFWDLVLIGTYIRPEKTAGGIIRPRENVEEDAYQSKTGVVLKFGEDVQDPVYNVGDWVVYSIKDGWAITVNGTPCRLVPYDRVRMKLSDPSVVF